MNNNDILRRIRYVFDYGDDQMIRMFGLVDHEVSRAEVSNWLKKDDDPEFVTLSDQELATFLNGFIVDKRGKRDGPPPVPETHLDNNIILRKLKIALNLRDDDMLEIFTLARIRISKHEISAFFRKPTQSQYRPCLDQFLRNFLHGMQIKYRGGK